MESFITDKERLSSLRKNIQYKEPSFAPRCQICFYYYRPWGTAGSGELYLGPKPWCSRNKFIVKARAWCKRFK